MFLKKYLFVKKKKKKKKQSAPKISLIFLYNEDKSMSFTKQKRKGYVITYFFRIEVKPPENMAEFIHTWYT